MPRRARVVIPHVPHHLTQRGVRRRQVFFGPRDYELYRRLLQSESRNAGVQVGCYCLMPNHVHLQATPDREDAFATALGRTHSQYARVVNKREEWAGHLWQERYYSSAIDAAGRIAVARYILLNPVRAGLVTRAEDWPYSSIHHHLGHREDALVQDDELQQQISDWRALLREDGEHEDERIRDCTRRRIPFGSEAFVDELERRTGQPLRWRKRGRPRKAPRADSNPG